MDDLRVPLDSLLSPVGVRRVEGRATAIDASAHTVTVQVGGRLTTLSFDRLVLAAGSFHFGNLLRRKRGTRPPVRRYSSACGPCSL